MQLKKEGVNGLVFYSGVRVFDKLFSFASVIILARLLSPDDFGLIALSMTAIILFQGMSEAGFEEALIQGQDITDKHFNVAWTYGRVVRGVFLFLLEFSLAEFISEFYNNNELKLVIQILAINELLIGFTNIGVVRFVKDGEFQRDFVFAIIGRTVRVISVIAFALVLKNVWALVASYFIFNLTNLIMSYRLHPFRPKFDFDLEVAKRLYKFGVWITFVQFINSARSIADKAVLGKLMDATQLGNYQVSSRIGMELAEDVKTIVSKVLFPILSTSESDSERIEKYHDVLASLLFFVFSVSCFISLNADLLVTLLLGEKWLSIIDLVEIMVFVAILKTVVTSFSPVLKAMGQPNQVFYLNLIQLVVLLLVIVPSVSSFGIKGAIYAMITSFMVAMVYWLILFGRCSRGIQLSHKKYIYVGLVSIATYLLIYLFREYVASDVSWGTLFLSILVYSISLLFFFRVLAWVKCTKTISVLNEKVDHFLRNRNLVSNGSVT